MLALPLPGVLGPALAKPGGPDVAGDGRNGGAAFERDRPLQVVSRDGLMEGERLQVRPGLVLRVVRTQEICAGSAAVLGRRDPFCHALLLAEFRIGADDDAGPPQDAEPEL